jgi:hypothetical protein
LSFSDLNSTAIPYFNTVSSGANFATVSVANANGNVGLHGSAGSSSGVWQSGSGDFDLFYNDQFTFNGSGAEIFQYALTLNASASVVGNTAAGFGESEAYGALGLLQDSEYSGQWGSTQCEIVNGDCEVAYLQAYWAGSDPVSQSATGWLQVNGGSTVDLGLFLWARTGTYNDPIEIGDTPNITALFDAEDTGFFTLTPVTLGADFTTASGLTYADSPETATTPEPSTLMLLGSGLLGLAGVARRKIKRSCPECEVR